VLVAAIRNQTPAQLSADIAGFATSYVHDWDTWLTTSNEERPEQFGRILRKWQATRPLPMRRLKKEAQHDAPFLDDLWQRAAAPLRIVAGCSVLTIAERTPEQDEAFRTLWGVFRQLPSSGFASCVGISKALLLLTEGRIGPALDSRVRSKLGVGRPADCSEWLAILQAISDDIVAFERAHGPIAAIVPTCFAKLTHGRLYDMALGPRCPPLHKIQDRSH
jgi:hypothetical protein